jgi:hypothetical protein
MPFHADCIAVILVTLSLLCACSRPPSENSLNSPAQKLPFDRQPRSTGISPSQSLIPPATKLPEGTPIPIRLQTVLSSASSHAGDTFSAVLDEPVVLDGQRLIDRGTPIMIETSTIFAKGGTRDGRHQATNTPSGASQKDKERDRDKDRDVVFGIDRRLNFRLVQAVDLQ